MEFLYFAVVEYDFGKKLRIPLPSDPKVCAALAAKYCPQEKWEGEFTEDLFELKRMVRYSKLNFLELYNLPLSVFLLIRRDSWIGLMKETENGRELLATIWRLSQTEPDLEAIRKFKNRERR